MSLNKTLLLHFAIWRNTSWGNFQAVYSWMHFLIKWEVHQLLLQMLKELETSKADCNNMLHMDKEAIVVEKPYSVERHHPTIQRPRKNLAQYSSKLWWSLTNDPWHRSVTEHLLKRIILASRVTVKFPYSYWLWLVI